MINVTLTLLKKFDYGNYPGNILEGTNEETNEDKAFISYSGIMINSASF